MFPLGVASVYVVLVRYRVIDMFLEDFLPFNASIYFRQGLVYIMLYCTYCKTFRTIGLRQDLALP